MHSRFSPLLIVPWSSRAPAVTADTNSIMEVRDPVKSRQDPSCRTANTLFRHNLSRDNLQEILCAVGFFALSCVLVACSSGKPQQPTASSQPAQTPQAVQSTPGSLLLKDTELASKSSNELATYIFEHHGCNSCHTLGKGGKLGFTDRGREAGKNFEGCIRMLTAMNVIAQVKEESRTAEEKERASKFVQFGCTTCHQITPGKLGLTAYGAKLKSLHMACTEVQQILSSKR